MKLTAYEQRMLDGGMGKAAQQALEYQIKVGEFFGADAFVPIQNAHMMGDIEVLGGGGFDFFQDMSAVDAQCAVNTTTNARCYDFNYVEYLQQDKQDAVKEKELIAFLKKMNVMTTDTCINYQSLYQPHLGEHVAWGDTGTVIYANSVLGARSNFESGPAAFAAALTGRVPSYGFHLDEQRKGTFLVNVDAELTDLADWGALGKLVGEKHQSYWEIPVFNGITQSPTSDQLKHLGASLASHGSMGMYHIVGVTPEARSVSDAFQGEEPPDLEVMTITQQDIEGVYEGFTFDNDHADLVVFSGPQLSLFELRTLAEGFEGKKIRKGTDLIITTNNAIKHSADELGYIKKIEEAGGIIMEGVCFYILHGVAQMRKDKNWHNLITNSAKLANIISAHQYHPVLRRTSTCIDIAISGKVI
jgi:predicted aconitase